MLFFYVTGEFLNPTQSFPLAPYRPRKCSVIKWSRHNIDPKRRAQISVWKKLVNQNFHTLPVYKQSPFFTFSVIIIIPAALFLFFAVLSSKLRQKWDQPSFFFFTPRYNDDSVCRLLTSIKFKFPSAQDRRGKVKLGSRTFSSPEFTPRAKLIRFSDAIDVMICLTRCPQFASIKLLKKHFLTPIGLEPKQPYNSSVLFIHRFE